MLDLGASSLNPPPSPLPISSPPRPCSMKDFSATTLALQEGAAAAAELFLNEEEEQGTA